MNSRVQELNTLGAILERAAERRPAHFVFVSDCERVTYESLWERSLRCARGLKAIGVGRGDHVGILMPNTSEFAAVFFGAALLGAVSVPLNIRYNAEELRFVVKNADLVALCYMNSVDGDRDLYPRLCECFPGLADNRDLTRLQVPEAPRLRSLISFNTADAARGVLPAAQLDASATQIAAAAVYKDASLVGERDPALVCYTSGTSAKPKGCVINHHAMVVGWAAGAASLHIQESDIVWAPCPLYHLSSLGPLVFVVALGGTLLTADYFEPKSAIALLRAENPTVWYTAVTSVPHALFDHPDYRLQDHTSARFMINAGIADDLQKLQTKFSGNSITSYGMTESAGLATVCEPAGTLEERTCNVGSPVEGMQVRIVNPDTGLAVGSGEPGEIQFRGTVFDRYYNNPEATAQTKTPEGWCHSGDIGKLNSNGTLTYLSRLKDMLKVGGENVAPVEIEECLAGHPAVKRSQVVGSPDARLGEVPIAFVETKEGAYVTEQELLTYCESRLARFKRPRAIQFITHWPQSITLGKIQKAALREMLRTSSNT